MSEQINTLRSSGPFQRLPPPPSEVAPAPPIKRSLSLVEPINITMLWHFRCFPFIISFFESYFRFHPSDGEYQNHTNCRYNNGLDYLRLILHDVLGDLLHEASLWKMYEPGSWSSLSESEQAEADGKSFDTREIPPTSLLQRGSNYTRGRFLSECARKS